MKSLSFLIVENDAVQAHCLKNELEKLGFSVLAITKPGREALSGAKKHCPDIVIDAELDEGKAGNIDGIKAAINIYSEHAMPIIYLSQYGNLRTYKKSKQNIPAYYVEKLVSILNILNSIDQIVKELEANPQLGDSKVSDRIFVKNGKGHFSIYLNDINFIKADREASQIHYQNQKQPATVSLNIGTLEARLAAFKHFVRCERSHIVNLKNVTGMSDKMIEDSKNGKRKVKRFLEVRGELVPIGDNYKNAVKARLHIL